MKRISKKIREEAALGCQLAASTGWNREDEFNYSHPQECSSFYQFFWNPDACELAEAARDHVSMSLPKYDGSWLDAASAPWAEAEALLRTGWTP